MGSAFGMDELKLNVFALHQVLVLLARDNNSTVVNENIASALITIGDGNKSITGLSIKPLHATSKTIGD
jgi:hypothetical protein